MIKGKQIENASITANKLSLSSPSSNFDPATKQYVDETINNSIYVQDWKSSCRVASTGNISIATAPAAIDGVTLAVGNRILLKNQTSASENGIYTFNGTGSALTRAIDADSSSKVTSGLSVYVEEGTTLLKTCWKISTSGAIVLGTTALTFEAFSTFSAPIWTLLNKAMVASVTTANGDAACATAIAGTPANDGYVIVIVNGLNVVVGDGVKTKECYFSGDNGSTAKTLANISSGDKLFWNGSIAGYQLDAADLIDFIYEI